MRMRYNPRHVGDMEQAWKSFLSGGLVASSFIFLVLTENAIVTIISLAFIVAGIALFVFNNINLTKAVFYFQNIFSAGAGIVVSLAFYLAGFLLLHLGVIIILTLATWLHKYKTPGKAAQEKKREEEKGNLKDKDMAEKAPEEQKAGEKQTPPENPKP